MNPILNPSENQPIIGHLDYAKDGYTYGWAFDEAAPSQKVMIEIVRNGSVVASGSADQYRSDLDELGIGDGNHGFKLRLSKELFDGNQHQLTARDARNRVQLLGGPITFGPQKALSQFDEIPRSEGFQSLHKMLNSSHNPAVTTISERLIAAYDLGSLAQETGKIQDANFAWNALNKVIGLNALCQCKLAENKVATGDIDEALNLYKNAASLDFSFHWAHIGISNILAKKGSFGDAIKALKIAISLQPSTEDLRGKLKELKEKELSTKVDTLLSSGMKHEAISMLRHAVKSNAGGTLAKELLDSLLVAQQESPKFIHGMPKLKEFKHKLDEFEKLLANLELHDKGVKHER
ncbi:hypothetical protein [Pseudomonas sp. WHRI 8519]|uniref:tetratricopeptide repeat protein n=1 Tax=Pseudomonas sp. WHRI 8519 TaxID=3162567 RepID=UPI0032ED4BBF